MPRVERLLDVPERRGQLLAEHLLGPEAAHDAIAMLSRVRAAKLQDQVRHVFGDGIEALHPLPGLEIDHRADVEAADAGVAVVASFIAMSFHELVETADILGQLLRRNRRVFYEGQWLGRSRDVHHQAEARLSHRPHLPLVRRGQHARRRIAEGGTLEALIERVQPGHDLLFGVARELDHEDVTGIVLQETEVASEAERAPGFADDHFADVLDRSGLILEDGHGRFHRFDDPAEVDHGKAPGLWNGFQVESSGRDRSQGPF